MQQNLRQVGDKSSHKTIVRKALGHAKSKLNMQTNTGDNQQSSETKRGREDCEIARKRL